MELRNRITMAPMDTNFGTEDGFVTEQIKDYFEARARGGAGLINIGATYVDCLRGKGDLRQLSICDDIYLKGLSELAQRIKKHGAKAVVQLHHAGRAHKSRFSGMQPVAPSAIQHPGGEMPRELTIEEIKRIIDFFVSGAVRAKVAGFDGIEVHAGTWYLLAQFLSPSSNKRQDAYGGSIENRVRLMVEILQGIRSNLGDRYPVYCRILVYESPYKYLDSGMNISDAKIVAHLAQEAGSDAIHISTYGFGRQMRVLFPKRPGEHLNLAKEIKKAVTIPVIANGNLSPEVSERAIRKGIADLVSIGRGLIADPELPNKLAQGKRAHVRPCIGCLYCLEGIYQMKPIECAVNPAAGREANYSLVPSSESKKVLVVGGGPGGMETARIATLRGHRVKLMERQSTLGGMLRLACLFNPEMKHLLYHEITQIACSRVEIRLNTDFSPDILEIEKPDVLILATGSVASIPPTGEADNQNVFTIPQLRRILLGRPNDRDSSMPKRGVILILATLCLKLFFHTSLIRFVSRFWLPFGSKVAVIGSDMVACEVARFLAERHRDVFIIAEDTKLASEMAFLPRAELLYELKMLGVSTVIGNAEHIGDEIVHVRQADGNYSQIEANSILLLKGLGTNLDIVQSFERSVADVYAVGDCCKPNTARQAIADAFKTANRI